MPLESKESPLGEEALRAWRGFLRAHARLVRDLDAELHERHDFALGDFDVLIQLAEAARGRLRMCDLAEAVLLSPSGLSRRVDRLERAGLVQRERGQADARNIEAGLTSKGRRLLRRLMATQRAEVKRRFADRFSSKELALLGELFGRLTEEPAGSDR